MKRLTIKKLIVISQSESMSLEIPFEAGLNIIIGENKTGKSSIIKSIFTTLGCECKKVESDWKKLISAYLLFFQYGENIFCIVRQGKKFQIFDNTADSYSCIIDTNVFHEYSNCLMDLLEIKMPCISKDGKQFNVTPPLLFRFQYIDQDDGWNKIAESFRNMAYIRDWKQNTNKYICGYLDDTYYNLKAQREKYLIDKENKENEFTYNKNFVEHITTSLVQIDDIKSVEDISKEISRLYSLADSFREKQFSCMTDMSVLENEIYINNHKLHVVEHNLKETDKDIEFAMTQEDELFCPMCGAVYSNNLEKQLNITSDYAHCEKLINELKKSIENATQELQNCKNEYTKISLVIEKIEEQIRNNQDLLSYSSFYKKQGKYEIYEFCKSQLDDIKKEISSFSSKIAVIDRQIKEQKSKSRSIKIREDIQRYCYIFAQAVNIPNNFIKLRDFVQTISHTGSEASRLVYMYQSALYLYNLSRANSPFNFYVIDTPNQQGQDVANLRSIFKSLELFLSDKGQVIVGTERETEMENKARNVIRLKEKRRCLNATNYKKHQKLLKELQHIADWIISLKRNTNHLKSITQ